MSAPTFGRIIWAKIPDQRGLAHEPHPAVIITPTDDIDPAGTVWVVGVSTKHHLASEEFRTPLQFDPTGRCRTKLRRASWAVSNWLAEVDLSSIEAEHYAGVVPEIVMQEIVRKIPGIGA